MPLQGLIARFFLHWMMSCRMVHHSVLIHSPAGGHNRFQFGAIFSKTVTNMCLTFIYFVTLFKEPILSLINLYSCFLFHCFIQAGLGDVADVVPDDRNKASCDLFAGGRCCLQFVKTQHLWSTVKRSAIKWGTPVLLCILACGLLCCFSGFLT